MTSTQYTSLPWDASDWFGQVSDWVDAQLQAYGYRATSPLEMVHQRPWSAFAQIATDRGTVYFKAPAPVFGYEAALTRSLATWQPDCMAPILAIDEKHGWILSPDTGVTLRRVGQTVAQIEHWVHVLPVFGQLQIDVANHASDMLALDVPDRRLAGLPERYNVLLQDTDRLLIDQTDGLTRKDYERLVTERGRFAEQCAELAAYNLPETIVHEEVHENNVLLGDGRYVLTDWSDCSVGHPLCSMLVTMRGTAHWLKLDENGPELTRMRDAYLEPWTSFDTRPHLEAALALATRVAMVNRALSWHQAIGTLAPQDAAEYADTVPGWLQDYADATA